MTATSEVKRRSRQAAKGVRKAAGNRWVENTARLGYVIRGILYGLMGVLAVGYAIGTSAGATDLRGGLVLLAGNQLRSVVLGVAVVGLSSYSLWGFIRAVYDPLKRGADTAGVAARLGFAWSGLNYGALAIFALGFALNPSGDGSGSMQAGVSAMLSAPAGRAVTVVAGVIGIAAGLGQFLDAYKATFRKDFKRNQMNRAERVVADNLGRLGMFSRGVVFTMLGWFVVIAGFTHDSGRSKGMAATFQTIAAQPFGRYILVIVATGFVALGVHSILAARWMRMLPSS